LAFVALLLIRIIISLSLK